MVKKIENNHTQLHTNDRAILFKIICRVKKEELKISKNTGEHILKTELAC